jgi:hypothetical protein
MLSQGTPYSKSQVFTTAGANSFIVPANVSKVWVTMVGGGGSGAGGHASGGGGGGGGAGSALIGFPLAVTPGSTLTCTVGAKGAAVAIATTGNVGTASTVTGGLHKVPFSGSTVAAVVGGAANGGAGGNSAAFPSGIGAVGGAGGAAGAGTQSTTISANLPFVAIGNAGGGGAGTSSGGGGNGRQWLGGSVIAGGANIGGGAGGGSFFGTGGVGGATAGNGVDAAATEYGAGGGGGGQNGTGGAGCDGMIMIEWIG